MLHRQEFSHGTAQTTRQVVLLSRDNAACLRRRLQDGLAIERLVGDDLEAMRTAARQNLVLFTTFPFFQRLFRASGFTAEAAQMERGAGLASLTDRLLDAVCLLGPVERCREQLAAFRTAGVDLPILLPPIGVDGARAVIEAFRR